MIFFFPPPNANKTAFVFFLQSIIYKELIFSVGRMRNIDSYRMHGDRTQENSGVTNKKKKVPFSS
jgi:hypothetical protein